MAKIKNISGDNFTVPSLGGRMVLAGQVVEVSDAEVYGFTCQEPNWAPFDDAAKEVHAAEVAARQPAPEGVEALLELDAKEAAKAVAEVVDVEVLLELVAAEGEKTKPRASVVKAAEARIAELAPPDPDTNPNPAGDDAGDNTPED